MVLDYSVGLFRPLTQLERRHVTSAPSENVTATQQLWPADGDAAAGDLSRAITCHVDGGESIRLTCVLVLFIISWLSPHTGAQRSALLASQPVNKPGRLLLKESLLTVVNNGARQAAGASASSLTCTARELGFRGAPIEAVQCTAHESGATDSCSIKPRDF